MREQTAAPNWMHPARVWVAKIERIFAATFPAAWVLLLALLPFTSLPFMVRLVRSEMVGSPAALPLVWLTGLWLAPLLVRGGSLPKVTLPMLGFGLLALIACAAAFFLDIPSYKDVPLISREVRALFTLAVGLAFFLVSAAWPNTPGRLRLSLQVINYSGLLILVWSLVQAYYWFVGGGYPQILSTIQHDYIALRGLFGGRVTGMAFEPSWLAHQLNLLYLPFWLSATINRSSAHRLRIFGLMFEDFLLVGGIAVLFLSFSRVGWLAFLLAAAFVAVRANLSLARALHHRLSALGHVRPAFQKTFRAALTAGLLLVFLAVYLGAMFGLAYAGSKVDKRMARLFETPQDAILSLDYANQLGFAERAVYWAVGWNVFEDYPVLGVGLGNAGYFFPEKVPPIGHALPEVNVLLYQAGHIPNTKSLWSRLVAETGLVGTACFLTALLVLWSAGKFLRGHPNRLLRVFGLAGGLALVSLLAEGFSVDSFAMPYWWVTFGLLAAASQLGQRPDPPAD